MANSKIVLATGEVLIDLTGDTITPGNVTKGVTFHGKDGEAAVGTSTLDSDTSEDTAAASEILAGKTAHARGQRITGSMPNNGGVSGSIAEKDGTYIVPQGFHDGSGSVGIADTEKEKLIPANIRQGVTVLGVVGGMSPGESVKAQAKSATPKFAAQTITPDAGYTHLTSVTVAAIPVTYADNSAGGKTVTIGAV